MQQERERMKNRKKRPSPGRTASALLFLLGLTALSAGTIGLYTSADFLYVASVEAMELPEPRAEMLSFHILRQKFSIPMKSAYWLSLALLATGALLLLLTMKRLLQAGPRIKRKSISGLRPTGRSAAAYPDQQYGQKPGEDYDPRYGQRQGEGYDPSYDQRQGESYEQDCDQEQKEKQSQRRGQRGGRKERSRKKLQKFHLEQEYWGLPGFQSLPPAVEDISPALRSLAEGFLREQSHIFGWQWYRFAELSTYPGSISDIEFFAKSLLSVTMERLYSLRATLYLLDQRGNYQAVLQKRGNIFVSGVKENIAVPEKTLIGRLKAGNYVLLNNGLDIFFPLPARGAMLGFLHLNRETVLNGPLQLRKVWQEICRYGELLWQARLYEQATSDPQSTLLNGMSFQKDLYQCAIMQGGLAIPLELTLIKFHNREPGRFMRLYGSSLRQVFPLSARLYRIALEVGAVLNYQLPRGELARRIQKLTALIDQKTEISIGSASWHSTMQSPNEWFRQAASALEQSEREEKKPIKKVATAAEAGK